MTTGSQIKLTPKAIRVAAGFDSVADLVGAARDLSASTALRIERGHPGVSVRKLGSYAKACGVSLVEIVEAHGVQSRRINHV